MPRNQFKTDTTYAGRLNDVVIRPIENSPNRGVKLLRIEFEVFDVLNTKTLRSFQKYACREIVIGNAVQPLRDANVLAYSRALGLKDDQVEDADAWVALKNNRPWISIEFGPVSDVDYRQPFTSIKPFSPAGYEVKAYGTETTKTWCSVDEAAQYFAESGSTMRRKADVLASKHGEKLMTYTKGGHRRINLEYLRILLDGE
jgi:hypothetical protein